MCECRRFNHFGETDKLGKEKVDPSWPKLTQFDSNWLKLTQVDPSRPKLTQVDQSWPNLTQVDQSWPKLTQNDPSWPKLTQVAQVDPRWPKLTHVNPIWHKLTYLDPSWPKLTKNVWSWVLHAYFLLFVLCGSMCSTVSTYVGLAKLHCGATPTSVMVLFSVASIQSF